MDFIWVSNLFKSPIVAMPTTQTSPTPLGRRPAFQLSSTRPSTSPFHPKSPTWNIRNSGVNSVNNFRHETKWYIDGVTDRVTFPVTALHFSWDARTVSRRQTQNPPLWGFRLGRERQVHRLVEPVANFQRLRSFFKSQVKHENEEGGNKKQMWKWFKEVQATKEC